MELNCCQMKQHLKFHSSDADKNYITALKAKFVLIFTFKFGSEKFQCKPLYR